MMRTVAAALCALMVGSAHASPAMGPILRTDAGQVQGRAEPGVDAFLGIPFAQPPLAELRWREPLAVKPWSGVRDATKISPACIQEPPTPFGPYTAEFLTQPEMSEDCLYLNVWAPKSSRGKHPVLVFIHGGAFQSGSTSVQIYEGADLARKGAVVVTVNYRLGVFGYLAHPDLTKESPLASSGNYGLLDMIAALRWVHANIARVGGDPANVTISGQSAGAIAVNDLLASPLAKGLFQRAIAESGPTLGLKMSTLDAAEKGGVNFARRVDPPTIAHLRSMSAKDVFSTFRGPAHPTPPFFPLPVMDGKVVISDPEIPTNPIVSKVPLIVGFNRDEAQPPLPVSGAAQFTAKVKAEYGSFADPILATYPHATDEEAKRSATELAQDRQIAGLVDWAERRALSSGQRVYIYLFDHPYPGPSAKQFKTFHTGEVPYVFRTLSAVPATAADQRVSDQVQARWLAFASRGDPSVRGLAWRDVVASKGQVMLLGDKMSQAPPLPTGARQAVFHDYFAQSR